MVLRGSGKAREGTHHLDQILDGKQKIRPWPRNTGHHRNWFRGRIADGFREKTVVPTNVRGGGAREPYKALAT